MWLLPAVATAECHASNTQKTTALADDNTKSDIDVKWWDILLHFRGQQSYWNWHNINIQTEEQKNSTGRKQFNFEIDQMKEKT